MLQKKKNLVSFFIDRYLPKLQITSCGVQWRRDDVGHLYGIAHHLHGAEKIWIRQKTHFLRFFFNPEFSSGSALKPVRDQDFRDIATSLM